MAATFQKCAEDLMRQCMQAFDMVPAQSEILAH